MWYNPIIIAILRSPLHFLVSGMYVLITFTGKKSGKTYSTPVQYKREGQVLKFVTRKSRTWWRNLRDGAPVTMLLRGQQISGRAEVLGGDETGTALQIQWVYAPIMSAAQATQLAKDSVVVQIQLAGA